MKPLVLILGLACVTSAGLCAQAPANDAGQAQIKAYVELMRKDIRTGANSIVDEAMGLEPADKAKFWTVYSNYQKEMKALWDQRLANIKKYADNYKNLTDAVAEQLATANLSNEAQNTAIKKKYYAEMKTALGARVAARFLQVEMMLGQIIGLQLASEIPLIP